MFVRISAKFVAELQAVPGPLYGRDRPVNQRKGGRQVAEVCIHDDGDAVLLKTMKDSGVLVKTEERLVKVQGAPD